MAFSRMLRLRDRRRIRTIETRGRRIETALGQAFILPAPRPHILFVIGKSVATDATERNRIRRILQEWANEADRRGRLGKYDVVVRIRKSTKESPRERLLQSAEELLSYAGMHPPRPSA